MISKRHPKHYLIFTPTEATLALQALLHFRNKAIARGIAPMDIDGLIKKTILKRKSGQLILSCPDFYISRLLKALSLPSTIKLLMT